MALKVLVAGATGMMGQKVASALLQRGASTRLLVRGGENNAKADQLRPLKDRGAEIVDGDVTRPDSLRAAVADVDVVVSTLQGGRPIIVDGQLALAKEAKKAGAKRFFPSDFSVYIDKDVGVDFHVWLGLRNEADKLIAEQVGIPQTNTYNGCFMEMIVDTPLGMGDTKSNTVFYWGDANKKYTFTTTDDVAQFVASAVVNNAVGPGPFCVVGDEKSPIEIAQILTKLTGHEFSLQSRGSLSDLDEEIDRRKQKDPDNQMAYALPMYLRMLTSGRGDMPAVHNHKCADVKPQSVESFIGAQV